MKFVFSMLMLSVLIGSNAYAAEQTTNGIAEAETACLKLRFTENQDYCLKAVADSKYIPLNALKLCAEMEGQAGTCIYIIQDKDFNDEPVKACSERRFAENINACLKLVGRPRKVEVKDLDKNYIRASIDKALDLMKDRNYEKAQNVLKSVSESLQ